MVQLKNDIYRKARGGKAFFVLLFCAKCMTEVLLYQKDGDGQLKRCYLNRIFEPPELERLQHDIRLKNLEDFPALTCPTCKTVLGMPIRHHDGRIAFRLRQGFFAKKRLPSHERRQ